LTSISEIEEKGILPVADAMSKKLVANQSFSPYLHQLIMKMDPIGAIGAVKAMAERSDSSTVLAEINVPILVLAGNADVLIPVETSRQMAELSKNIAYVELDGVGHLPMLEAYSQTADALNKLIHTSAGSQKPRRNPLDNKV
jgi:pimeloyl-ACP methyl ester carboxylesterase